MKNISFFLARRYLLKTAYENNVSTMVLISFIGIMIGSCALALVTAITNGFQTVIYKKMQGIHSQMIIREQGKSIDFNALQTILKQEFKEVAHVSPTTIRHGIIHEKDTEQSRDIVAIIKAIDPEKEAFVNNFATTIIPEKGRKDLPSLNELITDNTVLIGEGIAQELNISIGDSFEMLFPEEKQISRKKVMFDSTEMVVGGFFKTGIEEFDSSLVVCSFDFFDSIFPDAGIEQVNLVLKKDASEYDVKNRLKRRTDLDVYSWKDLYPALISALMLEKYVSFFILALITLVASMNMISLIFMQITQKRADIAILKVLGATDTTIAKIFISIGMIITTCASITGIMIASLISMILEKYPFIELPDAYYVSHLPSDMTWKIVLTVFILVMTLGFIAILIPVRKIKELHIANVLRFEG